VDLIKEVLSFPGFPTDADAWFTLELATDAMQANQGRLFEENRETKELIGDFINLSCFVARLLFVLGIEMAGEGDVAGLPDARFILGTALEDYPEFHRSPNIDIPATAQYVIHAGNVLFEACMIRFVPIFFPSCYLIFRFATVHIAFRVA